jgi:4-amino-4-deoxy-L-arabinose transferase-like glycosyltransferase
VLQRLFAVRLASVTWGIATCVFAYLLGFWWFGRVRDGLLIGVLAATQPMMGFLSSVVNNDAALFACGMGSFAALAWLRRQPQSVKPLVLLAVCSTAGVLSKPTYILVFPALGFAALLLSGSLRRLSSWLRTAATLAPAVAAFVLWSLYSQPAMRDQLSQSSTKVSLGEFLRQWVFVGHRLYRIWVKGYWMNWGWLDTALREPYYGLIAALLLLAGVGTLLGWRLLVPIERWLVVFTAGATLYGLAILYALELPVLRTGLAFVQGRYLLPIFPLHALTIVTGLRAFGRRFQAYCDAPWVFAAVLCIIDGAAIARSLVRYYS